MQSSYFVLSNSHKRCFRSSMMIPLWALVHYRVWALLPPVWCAIPIRFKFGLDPSNLRIDGVISLVMRKNSSFK
jgi:hypothetical protein